MGFFPNRFLRSLKDYAIRKTTEMLFSGLLNAHFEFFSFHFLGRNRLPSLRRSIALSPTPKQKINREQQSQNASNDCYDDGRRITFLFFTRRLIHDFNRRTRLKQETNTNPLMKHHFVIYLSDGFRNGCREQTCRIRIRSCVHNFLYRVQNRSTFCRLEECHGQAIYGVVFNPFRKEENVFATVGSNRVRIL